MAQMTGNELMTFDDVVIVQPGDNALLCRFDDEREAWIPRKLLAKGSTFSDSTERGDHGVVVIPKWLAEDRKLW